MTMGDVMGLVGRTFRDPKEGAAEVLSLGIPRESHFILVALVVVLSTILTHGLGLLAQQMAPDAAPPVPSVGLNLVMQFGAVVLLIALVQGVGRMFGGTAVVEETTVLICWLQFMMIFVVAVANLALIFAPPLGVLGMLIRAGLELWLLTHFVAVLHGFRALWPVFFGILACAVVVGFVVVIFMAMAGLGPQLPTGAA